MNRIEHRRVGGLFSAALGIMLKSSTLDLHGEDGGPKKRNINSLETKIKQWNIPFVY